MFFPQGIQTFFFYHIFLILEEGKNIWMILIFYLRNNLFLNGYFGDKPIDLSISFHGKFLLVSLFYLAQVGRRKLFHELFVNYFEFYQRRPYRTESSLIFNLPFRSTQKLYLQIYFEMEFLLWFCYKIIYVILRIGLVRQSINRYHFWFRLCEYFQSIFHMLGKILYMRVNYMLSMIQIDTICLVIGFQTDFIQVTLYLSHPLPCFNYFLKP